MGNTTLQPVTMAENTTTSPGNSWSKYLPTFSTATLPFDFANLLIIIYVSYTQTICGLSTLQKRGAMVDMMLVVVEAKANVNNYAWRIQHVKE